MDLTTPVVLVRGPGSVEEYGATVRREAEGSLAWISRPGLDWHVPHGLRVKVEADGSLRPFHGDTVVLPLTASDAAGIGRLQAALRSRLGALLAQPLDPAAFHVTLHDLSSGCDLPLLVPRLEANEAVCRFQFARLAAALDDHPECARVRLRSTCLYPSCNISIVLGLVPHSEADFRILAHAYEAFDSAVRLEYWPRLHVTLDYFRPEPLGQAEGARLHETLVTLAPSLLTLELDLWDLSYQRFESMNVYRTLFTVRSSAPHGRDRP